LVLIKAVTVLRPLPSNFKTKIILTLWRALPRVLARKKRRPSVHPWETPVEEELFFKLIAAGFALFVDLRPELR
jgi:hypothetical protein